MLTDDQISQYQSLVSDLEDDLLARVDTEADLQSDLRAAWESAKDKDRTADNFNDWLERYTTQIAVSWVLTTIFVRYLEDNGLIESTWIAGTGDAKYVQEDNYGYFVQNDPTASDTDYLLHVFRKMAELPAGELFGQQRNPLYRLAPSGDAGRQILKFFQQINPDTGELVHDFTPAEGEEGDTRFLGDLYQDLSEAARKRYALLQTPKFVEEFILDQTLEPAIDTFGLDEVRFIDPTCGSGHFLLGGFRRILDKKLQAHPDRPRAELVREALRATNGVDLNPFAVSIARFRLLIAALHELGKNGGEEPPRRKGRQGKGKNKEENRPIPLHEAPELPLNIAVGDSLIQGRFFPRFKTDQTANQTQLELDRFRWDDRFSTEDADLVYGKSSPSQGEDLGGVPSDEAGILMQQYHAVVGNPPYITVKDKAQNDAYREFYDSCYYSYSLVCPFYERFFQLAGGERLGDDLFTDREDRWGHDRPGYVGMIVGNAFMKRTFGQKLIQEIVPQTDLTGVIDTSGAYVPGHGTPTVILTGRNQSPESDELRAALGIRGEPSVPDEPAEAHVWSSIRDHIDEPGFENDFITVDDKERELFHEHPWTLKGGGALEAKQDIETRSPVTIADEISDIGTQIKTRADSVYRVPAQTCRRHGVPNFKPLVVGENVRDWSILEAGTAIWPYDPVSLEAKASRETLRFLWNYRTTLSERSAFGKTQLEHGLTWFEYSMFFEHRYDPLDTISYAFVSTHNHFHFGASPRVFKGSARVIKLPDDATEADHLGLLGLLNSSTACFWMKMVFFSKGTQGVNEGIKSDPWEKFYEHDATKLEEFPLVDQRPLALAERLDALGGRLSELRPSSLAERAVPDADTLDAAREESARIQRRMIALQEELDWSCYGLYGLSEDPPLALDFISRGGEPESGKAGELETTKQQRESGKAGELETTKQQRESGKAGQLEATKQQRESGKAGQLETTKQQRESGKAGELETTKQQRESGKAGELEATKQQRESGKAGQLETTKQQRESGKAGQLEHVIGELPNVKLGERPFEIVLARKMDEGLVTTDWFDRHGSTPRTDIPERWPQWYRDLVAARIERITGEEAQRFIRLIETPEYKRRWNWEDWQDLEDAALRNWLLDRLETDRYFPNSHLSAADHAAPANSEQQIANSQRRTAANARNQPETADPSNPKAQSPKPKAARERSETGSPKAQSQTPKAQSQTPKAQSQTPKATAPDPQLTTIKDLAYEASKDQRFLQVGARYTNDNSFDVEKLVTRLVDGESVPYLPAHRYYASGRRRRQTWEEVWELQRREDKISARTELPPEDPAYLSEAEAEALKQEEVGDIEKPPNYRKTDYKTDTIYRMRGKLDVPKERFTTYPGCETDDGVMRITWAGLDHKQRAQALASFYYHAKDSEGWPTDRLAPLLAGLLDLLPWVKQWHNAPDPNGTRFGDFLEQTIHAEVSNLGIGLDRLDDIRMGTAS